MESSIDGKLQRLSILSDASDEHLLEAGASPTVDLVVVLIKIFSAIVLGFICRRYSFIDPDTGDTKALKFFVGSIAFPLLIFNTIATAKLGSIDFGVILACSLAKLTVYWCVWVTSFCAYRPSRAKGQRFLTATVFSFFAIAGDDFATGFPVIDALYGSSMTVYIAANSLVGSLLMVPMTLVLFEIGKGLQLRDEAGEHPEGEGGLTGFSQARTIVTNILLNPVIFMTCIGIVFQLLFGHFLVEDPSGTKLTLPEPFASIIELWTGPFAMLALLSTGLSLTSASPGFWPLVLVLSKLVICAYLSYAFGLLFVYQEPKQQLHDFTFFYGSIPTSSAPLVFATAFDSSAVELIASAVLFGYVLAGPNMFVTALFLSQESTDLTATLNSVQSTAGILSAAGAAAFLIIFLLTRKTWTWAGRMLAVYSIFVLSYGLVDFHLANACQHSDDPQLELFVFNFLQKSCTLFVVYFQVILSTGWSARWHDRWQSWLVFVGVAALLAVATHPVALDQLCHLSPSLAARITAVLWSISLFAITLGLVLHAVRRIARSSGTEEATQGTSEAPGHPTTVFKVLCVAQGVRSLMQAVNSADFLIQGDGVFGGRVQLLIIEQTLEVGQGILVLACVLLQELDATRLRAAAKACRCGRAVSPDEEAPQSEPAVVFPELSFIRNLS